MDMQEIKANQKIQLPETDDLVKFTNLLVQKLETAIADIKLIQSRKNYRSLAKVLLCRVISFNRKRGGKVSGLKVKAFHNAINANYTDNKVILSSLTPEQRENAKNYLLVSTRGKCNTFNSVLFDKQMLEAAHLLINARELAKNVFSVQMEGEGKLRRLGNSSPLGQTL